MSPLLNNVIEAQGQFAADAEAQPEMPWHRWAPKGTGECSSFVCGGDKAVEDPRPHYGVY